MCVFLCFQYKMTNCGYNRMLQKEAPMKSMLIAFQCLGKVSLFWVNCEVCGLWWHYFLGYWHVFYEMINWQGLSNNSVNFLIWQLGLKFFIHMLLTCSLTGGWAELTEIWIHLGNGKSYWNPKSTEDIFVKQSCPFYQDFGKMFFK